MPSYHWSSPKTQETGVPGGYRWACGCGCGCGNVSVFMAAALVILRLWSHRDSDFDFCSSAANTPGKTLPAAAGAAASSALRRRFERAAAGLEGLPAFNQLL
jgi:hypothetical protein